MSKINTRVSAGVQADSEFSELMIVLMASITFIAVAIVFSIWVADAGIVLPLVDPTLGV